MKYTINPNRENKEKNLNELQLYKIYSNNVTPLFELGNACIQYE